MSLPRIGDRIGSNSGSEGLPPGYTRLEYIQSTGTQYIKTDFFVPAEGLYLWADVQFVGTSAIINGNENFFDYSNISWTGANIGSSSYQIYELYNWWGNYNVSAGKAAFAIVSSKEVVNSRNIYEVKDLTVTYGPHQLSIPNQGLGAETEFPFLIFGRYRNGAEEVQPFGRWNMRIFEMKLGLRDGTIVQHLVPVLDSNDRPGLHDLISGQTFRNGGEGEFLFN